MLCNSALFLSLPATLGIPLPASSSPAFGTPPAPFSPGLPPPVPPAKKGYFFYPLPPTHQSRCDPGVTSSSGRFPFNQNFRKFRSETEWNGSDQPGNFQKRRSTFRDGPFFRLVRSDLKLFLCSLKRILGIALFMLLSNVRVFLGNWALVTLGNKSLHDQVSSQRHSYI